MWQQNRVEVRKWTYHLAMVGGAQYMQQMGVGDFATLGMPKVPAYRVRSVTNILRPMVRMEIANYTSQKPTAVVTPATGETEDFYAAQAAEQVWESIYRRQQLKKKWARNAFWYVVTGNAFVRTTWNNAVELPDVDAIYELSAGEKVRLPAQGDVNIANVTPFHLFVPDLLEQEIEDQPYVFQAYVKPLDWARRQFNDPGIMPDCKAANEILDSVYFSRASVQGEKADSVLVLECWMKPGALAQFPDGCFATVVNEKVVGYVDHMPYGHQQFPFAHAITIDTGKFYGASVLEDAIPIQKEYNNSVNQIIESKRRMGRPQWVVPKGSIDVNRMTSEPGAVLQYEAALGEPRQISGTPIPSYVVEEPQRIKQDFEDITGQHAVSRGSTDGSVVAATAISFLQERDDALRQTGYDHVESLMEKVGQQALSLFAAYVEVPRSIKVVGSDKILNVLELKGSDIAAGTDLNIEGGSALPQSKSAKTALLMDLFQAGAISNQDLLSLMDMGGVQVLTDRLRIDRAEAQRENLRFKNLSDEEIQQYEMQVLQADPANGATNWVTGPDGAPLGAANIIPVEVWQNHPVHIDEHNNFRKTTEYMMLNDEAKRLLEDHIQDHQHASMGQASGMPGMGLPPEMNPDATGSGQGSPETVSDQAQAGAPA
jgi:hypothetical protein